MSCTVRRVLALLALCVCGGAAPAQRNQATATAGAGATIVTGLDVRAGGGELAVSGGPYATYSVTLSSSGADGPITVTLIGGPTGTCLLRGDGSWTRRAGVVSRPGACDVLVACN